MTSPTPNGGDPCTLRARLGLGDRPLLDFATGINPLGPHPAVIEAARRAIDTIDEYPEPHSPRLTERLAEMHGVSVDRVIVGAGTTELISLIGQCLREVLALHAEELGNPRMTLSHIVEPTRPAYRRASVLNELRTEVWSKHVLGWSQEFLPRSAAGIYWTGHPNDPTGRAWDRERLLRLVDDTEALLTVVDESFLPFLPDEAERTLIPSVPTRSNLLVLRSLTKIHAIPGARVGYAVTSADMVTRLKQYQSPSSVTAPAQAAALAAIEVQEHVARGVEIAQNEANRLMEHLWDTRELRPVWPARERPPEAPLLPNFLLVSLAETPWTAPEVRDALARRGLLVRDCSDIAGLEVGALLTGPNQLVATQGHLRIAVRTPAENDRLLGEVKDVLASDVPR